VDTSQPLPSEFAEPLARAAARIHPFGARVLWFADVTSTNDVALRLGDADAGEGVLVIADRQTAGRGRRGRQWASPPAAGVYATVLVRPGSRVTALVTVAAGVAVAEGIQAATGLPAIVKWPNDVLIPEAGAPGPGRKVAGILAEGGTSPSGPWVALGIGINVLPGAFPPDVAVRATALERELGRPVDRAAVLVECLAAFSARYADLRYGRIDGVLDAWRARAASTLGRQVEWDGGGRVCEGVARGIDDAGALLVHADDGVHRIVSGEVRWR
jgi:BirA family biotin operon repressor/biotin-[acetyl-CoA-carboxylase] ligase